MCVVGDAKGVLVKSKSPHGTICTYTLSFILEFYKRFIIYTACRVMFPIVVTTIQG